MLHDFPSTDPNIVPFVTGGCGFLNDASYLLASNISLLAVICLLSLVVGAFWAEKKLLIIMTWVKIVTPTLAVEKVWWGLKKNLVIIADIMFLP